MLANGNDGDDIASIKKYLIGVKAADIPERTSFVQLFDQLYQVLENYEEVNKSTVLTIDTLTIWLLRANQYVRSTSIPFSETEISSEKLILLLQFICDYFDAGSGALPNAMTSLLTRLCQFTNEMKYDNLSSIHFHWLESIVGLPKTLKSYFVIIDTLCKDSVIARQILTEIPTFPNHCIKALEYDALANVASKAFGSVHINACGQGESYMKRWEAIVIEGLLNKKTRSNVASHLLPVLFKGQPDLYIKFFRCLRDQDYSEDVFLAVAKIGHNLVTNFEGIKEFNKILQILSSADSQKRLDALEVIVGCIKSTKLTAADIMGEILSPSCLEVFFKESHSPKLRNRFVTMLRKAMLTWRDFISNCERQIKIRPEDTLIEEIALTKDAIVRIKEFTSLQYSPSLSYCQLILANDMLQFFIDQEFDGITRHESKNKKNRSEIVEIFSSRFIQVLLRMASNNYEDVRRGASKMLSWCPYDLFVKSMPENTHEYLTNTIKLLSSSKGRQSDSAAQLFLSLADIYQRNDEVKYEEIVRLLNTEFVRAASSFQPIHGFLTAFTYILSETQPCLFGSKHEYFDTLICSLLEQLDLNWKRIKIQLLTSESLRFEIQGEIWRVIKESSGLIGVLMKINVQNEGAFIGRDTFLSICDTLMDQLATVTHRGAFSAICPTFVEACHICMDIGLQQELREWLANNLKLIRTHTQLISRRSGGLPFLITAILKGMSSYQEILQKALLDTFTELLSIASAEYTCDGSETMDIPQVHALNCMKHIVGESLPNALMGQYISSALQISLQNLDHQSWSMKNAAVMLFTSLQIRIFGSNKMGDVVPKMNAPLFFLKFPGVSHILLDKLEKEPEQVDVIIPILSILSRLANHKPGDERVESFLSILENQYVGHKVWKVREMTASIIPSLMHSSQISERAVQLADKLPVMTSNNEIHGALMCVASMMHKIKSADSQLEVLDSIINKMLKFFKSLCLNEVMNWLILSACIKVLEFETNDSDTVLMLKAFLSHALETPTGYPDALRRLCLKACADLTIKADLDAKNVSSMIANTQHAFQRESEYEVLFTYLEFWENNANSESSQLCQSLFNITDISRSVQDLAERLLQNAAWSIVTARVLEFLVSQKLCLKSIEHKGGNSNIRSLLFFLQINGDGRNDFGEDLKPLKEYAAENQPSETRVASVQAAKVMMTQSDDSFIRAEASFLLFQKLFDASSQVRQASSIALARHLGLASNEVVTVGQSFVPFFIKEFGSSAYTIFEKECHSIDQNLADAVSDLENSQFEVDSDNLYIDEVAYHKLIVSGLRTSKQKLEVFLNDCIWEIRSILDHISRDFHQIITTWTYNYHVETAIAKAFNYLILLDTQGQLEKALNELAAKLKALGYPKPG